LLRKGRILKGNPLFGSGKGVSSLLDTSFASQRAYPQGQPFKQGFPSVSV